MARLLLAEGGRGVRTPCPLSYANSADRRVFAGTLRLFGGLSGTPARRAFESPMAITCFAERAPCLPCRTWWISSRTNSPAAVEALFPLRRSSLAFLTVRFDGIPHLASVTHAFRFGCMLRALSRAPRWCVTLCERRPAVSWHFSCGNIAYANMEVPHLRGE